MARTIMIQGTASHAGKTVMVAGLCRMLARRGMRVAPFKAQNMALNSFVTRDGFEIGRAQAFQAEAAGIEPRADMNPVLLKPTADSVSQVIVRGRVWGQMSASEFHNFKRELRDVVYESYMALARDFDFIVAEGAGSPAEVNLRTGDIANMGFATMADCPVLLVADIDRGGAFASLVGTMELLSSDERARVKGFIINKFRGDRTLLDPGLEFLAQRTGVPVAGVVPYLGGLDLPEEDGVSLERAGEWGGTIADNVTIAVVRLPRISNFTDLDPLAGEPGVSVAYINDARGLAHADMVVIPGTKNTIADLLWMRSSGLEQAIKDHASRGAPVLGICGGFQMLGRRICDPDGVEGNAVEVKGMGLLDVDTVLKKDKKTFQVEAEVMASPHAIPGIKGYEIHMGESESREGSFFSTIVKRGDTPVSINDGAVRGHVAGTYIHGLFDNDGYRASVVNGLREKKGLLASTSVSFSSRRHLMMERLADEIEKALLPGFLAGVMGTGGMEPIA